MSINLLTEDFDETSVPDKFKDPETGGIHVQQIVNSYRELEKKMSSKPGAPASADDYCIECNHGLFGPDADVNRRLHEKGLSQEQAQEVYNLAADKMVPLVRELAMEYEAEREVEKLVSHFGGADAWQEVSRQLLSYGRQNLPEKTMENLASSYDGVLALYKMMKGQEPNLKSDDAVSSAAPDDTELKSMMRDPKYWRDKDPAFIKKVTQGFQSLYGN